MLDIFVFYDLKNLQVILIQEISLDCKNICGENTNALVIQHVLINRYLRGGGGERFIHIFPKDYVTHQKCLFD